MNYENAIRRQYRFMAPGVGSVTLEDLWQLQLETLDSTGIRLRNEVETLNESSFLRRKPNPKAAEAAEKLEIVKHIIEVRLAEQDARTQAELRRSKAAELREILRDKKAEEMRGMSAEELEAQIAELEQ